MESSVCGVQAESLNKIGPDDFKMLRMLASFGTWSDIHLVEKLNGSDKGSLYAMKVMRKAAIAKVPKQIEHCNNELEVLKIISGCPFNSRLIYAFQTTDNLYIVTEFNQGGDLYSFLDKNGVFSENEAAFYVAEIVAGIDQMHKQNIVYRDLKLENMTLNHKGHIVITDYGAAKLLKEDSSTSSFCGTALVMSPDMARRTEPYGLMTDWWSLGIIVVELLTGCSPFSAKTRLELLNNIINRAPIIDGVISETAKDLIMRLLEKDPKKRIGSNGGANEIKSHPFFDGICWKKISFQSLGPPVVPILKSKFDCSMFDDQEDKTDPEQLPESFDQSVFSDFFFVAPGIKLSAIEAINVGSLKHKRPMMNEIRLAELDKTSKFFEKYKILDVIGIGTFSICIRCMSIGTREKVAVKVLRVSQNEFYEIEALIKCDGHANIVKLIEVFNDSHFQYLVFEFLEGLDLSIYAMDNPDMSESKGREIFYQIVSAVQQMHMKGIVHRDLKLENVVFVHNDKGSALKIIDFGLACNVNQKASMAYSLAYASPESLKPSKANPSRDVWSLGVILYKLLTREFPFSSCFDDPNSRVKLAENIKAGRVNTKSAVFRCLSESARDLIFKMLQVNEDERLTAEEILNHPWMKAANYTFPVSKVLKPQQQAFESNSDAIPVPENVLTSQDHVAKLHDCTNASASNGSQSSLQATSKRLSMPTARYGFNIPADILNSPEAQKGSRMLMAVEESLKSNTKASSDATMIKAKVPRTILKVNNANELSSPTESSNETFKQLSVKTKGCIVKKKIHFAVEKNSFNENNLKRNSRVVKPRKRLDDVYYGQTLLAVEIKRQRRMSVYDEKPTEKLSNPVSPRKRRNSTGLIQENARKLRSNEEPKVIEIAKENLKPARKVSRKLSIADENSKKKNASSFEKVKKTVKTVTNTLLSLGKRKHSYNVTK